MRHLLSLLDLNTDEIEEIFEIAGSLKRQYENGVREPLLQGRVMGLLFEKPSLRTRVSFEAGMTHLGGTSQFLGRASNPRGSGWPPPFSFLFSSLPMALSPYSMCSLHICGALSRTFGLVSFCCALLPFLCSIL